MSRIRPEAIIRPADANDAANRWEWKPRVGSFTAPAVDVPIVCVVDGVQRDARVRLTRPVDVSHGRTIERAEPGDELTIASWQADNLVRDGHAIAIV